MRLRRFAAGGALALALLAAGGALALRGLPDPAPLADPAWVRGRFKLEAWTPLESVPAPALAAVLASEDDSYYSHHGVRPAELWRAAWSNLGSLGWRRGASTITQQVVRNAFLDRRKSVLRKWRELWLARRADRAVGKRAVLEDYLNLAEWGPHGERGIAAGARLALGKPVGSLDALDGALLSWLLPNPRRRGPRLASRPLDRRAARHARFVLRQLEAAGTLDPAAAAAAQARLETLSRGDAPSMVDGARGGDDGADAPDEGDEP